MKQCAGLQPQDCADHPPAPLALLTNGKDPSSPIPSTCVILNILQEKIYIYIHFLNVKSLSQWRMERGGQQDIWVGEAFHRGPTLRCSLKFRLWISLWRLYKHMLLV